MGGWRVWWGIMGDNLDEIGPKLEKTLDYERALHGEEAEAFYRYKISRGLRILEEKTEPVPELFRDVVRLYGLNVPVYVIPVGLMGMFTDAVGPGAVWWDTSTIPPRPIAILLASDAMRRGYRNRGKSMFRSLLFCIGHILFSGEICWFVSRMIERTGKLADDAEGRRALMAVMRLAVTGRLEKWEREQYRMLKRLVNSKMTGWRRGLSFKRVRRLFRYDHGKYRTLFEFEGRPPPRRIQKKKVPRRIMLLSIDQIKLPDWLRDEEE